MSSKDKTFRFDMRKHLVQDVLCLPVKATARKWGCSRNTVRLWLRRYLAQGLQGLKERSHAPASCPHRTPPDLEQEVLRRRRQSGFGARRLKEQFDLPCSHGAIGRILREHHLTRKHKTKPQKKNDLRAVKALLRAFERVEMDVKYLTGLPFYLPQIELLGLPRFQYTIRDARTGLLYLCFADQISKTHAAAAAAHFLRHLRRHGVPLQSAGLQTDNGAEFDGQSVRARPQGFTPTVQRLDAGHGFIPPACPNANADVETVHSLMEAEFYDRELFRDRAEFLGKAWTYNQFFNLVRKNSYQGWRTPLERLRQAAPHLPQAVALLAPVHLDTLLPRAPGRRPSSLSDLLIDEAPAYSPITPVSHPPGGQHQPRHPGPCTCGRSGRSRSSCRVAPVVGELLNWLKRSSSRKSTPRRCWRTA